MSICEDCVGQLEDTELDPDTTTYLPTEPTDQHLRKDQPWL